MHKNVQTDPEKSQNFTQHSCCSMLTREKNLKAIRGNGYLFVPKGGTFPTETIMLVVRSSCLWEAYSQTCPKWEKNLYHDMLMPLHDSMPSFMNFTRVLDLLEFENQVSQRFAGNQQCPGVWISFPSLEWDLEIHPRTHMWFFNQLWCIGACACSLILNCAHEMARKPV